MKRRLRLGMVGGGQGAFIGAVHRLAARMDDHYELLAAALSADPANARSSALALGLDPAGPTRITPGWPRPRRPGPTA